MPATVSRNKVFLALCINAVALFMILFVVLSHDNGPSFTPAATAQTLVPETPKASAPRVRQPEISPSTPMAGGDGLFVMPAQLSPNTWGAYLLDVNSQTLSVYQYEPGVKMLRLNAARNIRYDHQLGNFNTAPPPMDIKDLVDHEDEVRRTISATTQPADSSTEK